jgi:hypothetical protein
LPQFVCLLLQEPWRSIMQALYAKGILVIRTAGNEGNPVGGQGLFYAGEAHMNILRHTTCDHTAHHL